MDHLPDVSGQPLWAQVVFVICIAVVYAVVHLGIVRGRTAKPEATSAKAQVAAVIVDSGSLDRATASIEAVNVTLTGLNMLIKQYLEDQRIARDDAEIAAAEQRIAAAEQRGYDRAQAASKASRPRTRPTRQGG